MKFVKKFWWLFLAGLLIGGLVMASRMRAEIKTVKKNSYTVKREDLTETLALSGTINAHEKAEMRFQTSGLLAWVGVKEGDEVRKYQSIASLDKRELQNSLTQYLNSYSKERNDFEQALQDNKDWETRSMSDTARDEVKRTLEKNQMDLNNSVLALEARSLAIKFATIYAPFEGLITRVDVPTAGTNITPSSAVFHIVNPKTLFFSATADQTEVVNFSKGMKGEIVLEAFPEIKIASEVTAISFVPKSGESSTVYEIQMVIGGAELIEKMRLGMTGDANFVIKERKAVLSVPEQYLTKENGNQFVTKLVNNQKIKTEVKIAETIDGMAVISDGLNEGDVVYYQP